MSLNVQYIYKVIDRFSAPLEKISKNARKYDRVMKKSARSTELLENRMKKLNARASEVRGKFVDIAAAGALIALPVKSFVKFEDALSDVGRVIENIDLKLFGEVMKNLAPQLGKTAVQLLEIAYQGAKLEILPENMVRFVTMVSKVASAFDMLDEEAGRAIGSIKSKLSLTIESTEKLMNQVNFLADTTSSDGARMIQIIQRLSGQFQQLALPTELIAGFAAFADIIEVTPELAASGMNMMFQRMKKNPALHRKLLEDPLSAVNEELERLSKMDPLRRQAVITKMYGLEAEKFIGKAIGKLSLLNEVMEKASSSKALTSIDKEFENVTKRMSFRLKQFAIHANNAATSVGEGLSPTLSVFMGIGGGVLKILKHVNDRVTWLIPVVSGLAFSFVALRVATLAYTFVSVQFALAMATLGMVLPVVRAGMLLLNAAFMANPIGFVIGAVLILVSTFNLLYKHFEPFTKLVDTVISKAKELGTWFSGILSGGGDKTINIVTSGGAPDQTSSQTASTAASNKQAANNNNSMDGNITVTASQGASIENANIGLNGGQNLATAQ